VDNVSEPSEQAQEDEKSPQPTTRSASILHISDLHFGRNFDPDKWDELGHLASELKPDLVVISGDVVNSPWRHQFKTVAKRLKAFEARINDEKHKTKICLVPGNHDTRFTGLIRTSWITLFATFAATAGLAWLIARLVSARSGESWFRGLEPTWSVIAASALVVVGASLGVLRALLASPRRGLDSFLLKQPALVCNGLVGILPFDSGKFGSSASGKVQTSEMVKARAWVDQQLAARRTKPAPFLIAVVHHHPLPLPYDHEWEKMMVMTNAGEFLRQLGHSRVRLVLHGHKHHQHFARLAVDPASDARLEVCVLSAGTPTEGRGALPHSHGFNFVVINEHHEVQITTYESRGGPTFANTRSFSMLPSDEYRRHRYESSKRTAVGDCRLVTCAVDINEFGDGSFTREFRGFKALRAAVTELPTAIRVQSEAGVVEDFGAEFLSLRGPGVSIVESRKAINELEALIRFKSSGLMPSHGAVDFEVSFLNNNAFALNPWQFRQMYPGHSELTENVQFVISDDVAIEDLVIHVHFPSEFRMPSRVDARWRPITTECGWRTLDHAEVIRISSQNILQLHLRHPFLSCVYQITWDVEGPRVIDKSDTYGPNLAISLRERLANLARFGSASDVCKLIDAVVLEFQDTMSIEEGLELQATLFGYDTVARKLLVVAQSDSDGFVQPYTGVESLGFPFGVGLPGRAFKTAQIVTFLRPADPDYVSGLGYVSTEGELPTESDGIPECGVISLPLVPREATQWPYGVLQVGWYVPSESLAKLDEKKLGAFADALSTKLTPILQAILS
jgi:3',5'-cyclic AMP phosphodiesterase CpdA